MLQFVLSVWAAYWPAMLLLLIALPFEIWRPVERQPLFGVRRFNLLWYGLLLITLAGLDWAGMARRVAVLLPGPLLPLPPAPDIAGALLNLLIVVASFDFISYWLHRAMHAFPAGWAMHRIHHDEVHLNASTSLRVHWMEMMINQACIIIILIGIYGPAALNGDVFLFVSLMSVFSHMNLRLDLRGLTPLIVGPALHRVHHARDPVLGNRNFATVFPLWDILFGTYQPPLAAAGMPLGVANERPSDALLQAYLAPLRTLVDRVRHRSG